MDELNSAEILDSVAINGEGDGVEIVSFAIGGGFEEVYEDEDKSAGVYVGDNVIT